MVNRCPHFNEGILPILNIKIAFFMLTTSMLWSLILLILLPRTSLAVGATKYETAYACEGKTLTIECEPGDLISLIRANYGRFSITICNDHGDVDWSVNCMSPKSLIVLNSKCAHKENCSVLASTNMFGDPCPGTHKYLEAHYQCISATQTVTTTRPLPSWLLTRNPSSSSSSSSTNNNNLWSTTSSTLSTIQNVTPSSASTSSTSLDEQQQQSQNQSIIPGIKHKLPSSSTSTANLDLNNRNSNTNSDTEIHLAGRPPNSIPSDIITDGDIKIYKPFNLDDQQENSKINPNLENLDNSKRIKSSIQNSTIKSVTNILHNHHQNQQSTILNNNNNNNDRVFGDDNSKLINNLNIKNGSKINGLSTTTYLVNNNNNNKIDINLGNNDNTSDYYCGPTTSRNLFWNITRVGDVNVQPCPGGATGIAKWRCILIPKYLNNINNNNNINFQQQNYIVQNNILLDQKHQHQHQQDLNIIDSIKINCDKIITDSNNNNNNNNNNKNCDKYMDKMINGNLIPVWYPQTPDLTQCRSLWLNNLEISVNQRDSSLISIANDLSQVTSSKTLYGGDMLVTTKIIQTMSEKMSYDIETFPDQRQREAIIKELLLSVVKTSSNLLDESQHLSWLDLSFEDQMRVATSLLTGLEHNAFLLADSTIREKDVLQSVKNILLSVRVVETKNIGGYEVFPDSKRGEHWSISDDRIELPRGALIENRQQDELVRIVFVAFDRLESILKPSYDNLDIKMSKISSAENNTNVIQRARILNSKVISASLGKGRHIQLSQPIKLILRHLKSENVSNPTCVYWNYIDHAWSSDGCFLETTNHTHSICMCNHLTNFAILMDVIDEHQISLLSMFDNKLRIFIYISIAICILFIIIAILTLKLFNAAFIKSTRTSIYKNIYVCLFIIEILFLLGVEQNETSLLCGFTTAFLHCFILSAIAWLFFEGFQLYVTLTIDDMVLEIENNSKIIWYYLLSYGLSFTIVAISLAIDPGTYTQSDFCVLMEANGLFYTTFMAPIVLFMIGAIGYTILAGYTMLKKNKSPIKNKEHSRLANVRFDLRCSFVFLMILSADWIFAYLYLRKAQNDNHLSFTYGYLFVTFNSLLGIYIFIFHCIQNEKIRREYRKYIRQKSWLPKCLRCSKTSSISSSSAVSQHHHHHHQQQQQQQQHLQQQQQLHYNTTGASGYRKSPISNNIDQINDIGDITIVSGVSGSGIIGGILPITNDDDVNSVGICNNIDNIISTSLSTTGGGDKNNSVGGHIILERSSTVASGSIGGGGGTLRTPSCGHTSPTSSVGSTHLIFNPKQQHNEQQQQKNWNYLQSLSSQQQQQQQQQQQHHQHPEYYSTNQLDNKNLNNTYDDKFIQYDCKSKRLKNHPNNLLTSTTTPRNLLGICSGGSSSSSSTTTVQPSHIQQYQQQQQQQQHEYFYWTEKNNHNKKNKLNGDIKYNKKSNNDETGGNVGGGGGTHQKYYPSYKKTTTIMRQYQQQKHDNDKLSDCEYPLNIDKDKRYYQQQQQQQQQNPSYRYNTKYQQKQHQNIDDDNCSGSGGDVCGPTTTTTTTTTDQHLLTSNCLNNCMDNSSDSFCGNNSISISSLIQHPNDCYQSPITLSYHQHYKNNKHSNCDLTNDIINDDCTNIVGGGDSYYNHHHHHHHHHHQQQQHQSISGDGGGGSSSIVDEPVYEEILNSTISDGCNDINDGHNYDDDDDDDDEDNELNCILDNEQYNKIRRMMSNKEDRQTFYRHDIAESLGIGKNLDINNTLDQQQQIASDLSIKKLSNKKKHHQQQQQQKIHQKSTGIVPLTQPICLDDKNSGQHHIVGRNISAMLDENNTVVCYLEPLPK